MNTYSEENKIQTYLNNYCYGTPFTNVMEAGPDIYRAWIAPEKQFETIESLFGEGYEEGLKLSEGCHGNIIHIAYSPPYIRYIEMEVRI